MALPLGPRTKYRPFETRHPIGSRARLAFALLLFTAQRRGDVVRMGRQHVRNGAISVRQQKTGAALEIPIHQDLQTVLDATPSDHLTFLVTEFGKPFASAGFGNWFRDRCNEAGLPRHARRTGCGRQPVGGLRTPDAPRTRLRLSAATPAFAKWSDTRRRRTRPGWLRMPSTKNN